jgi:hypothetical protein
MLLKNFHHASEDTAVELVEAITENDLIDLTARLILLLKPDSSGSSHETGIVEACIPISLSGTDHANKEMNINSIAAIHMLFDQINRVIPKQLLESKFSVSFLDWAKFRLYLLWRVEVTDSADSVLKHIRLFSELWDEVGCLLGLHHDMERVRLIPASCSYTRCPDPLGMKGAQFICSTCFTVYCNARCQAL